MHIKGDRKTKYILLCTVRKIFLFIAKIAWEKLVYSAVYLVNKKVDTTDYDVAPPPPQDSEQFLIRLKKIKTFARFLYLFNYFDKI